MIGVFVSTTMESAGLRRRMLVEERVQEADHVVERGKCEGVEMLLVQTGMGKKRAQAAAESVFSRYTFDAVVSLGLSGALVPRLRVGEIVLCTAIARGSEGRIECDPDLLLKATSSPRLSLGAVRGVGATSDGFVSGVEAKQEMASELEAVAVDMESYWTGKAAAERGLPFISVRAISDSLTGHLPPMERFIDADGGLRWRSVAAACVERPRMVFELVALGRDARRAARNLTAYFVDLLPAIGAADPKADETSRQAEPVWESS